MTVTLALPFADRWLTQNSPATRVPSHGTDLFGQRYAIDFVGVDERFKTAPTRDWRSLLATEPPERFFAFGRPILAPVDGLVVAAHDGEGDHAARRSQLALIPYMLGQASRARRGIAAVAGNHVIIDHGGGVFIVLVHLKCGTLRVSAGESVIVGQQLAECGNSGNSTQPHVHVHATDRRDASHAEGVPIQFSNFREWLPGSGDAFERTIGIPANGAVVEALS